MRIEATSKSKEKKIKKRKINLWLESFPNGAGFEDGGDALKKKTTRKVNIYIYIYILLSMLLFYR